MKLRLMMLFSMLFAVSFSSQVQAAVVVTVDDKASDDSAYVNGQGGNLSGPGAFASAINAINNDPTSPTTFEVKLIDTDGALTTYEGAARLRKPNVTIHQVPNGSNTDTTITFKTTNGVSSDTLTLEAPASNCTISGLSADRRLDFQTANALRGIVCLDSTPTLNYVNFGGTGKTLLVQGSGIIANSCCFENSRDWGLHLQGANPAGQFNNCLFTPTIGNGDFYIILITTAPVVFNNCIFSFPAGPNHWGGSKDITFNDCTFDGRGRGSVFVNSTSYTVGAGCKVTINRPVFVSASGTVFINTGDSTMTVTINGASPSNKADLRPVRTATGANLGTGRWGTYNFNDCIIDDRFDCAGNPPTGRTAQARFNFNRCLVTNADFGAVNNVNIERYFTANNCFFDPTGAVAVFDSTSNAKGGMTVNHCTFAGTPTIAFYRDDGMTQANTINYSVISSASPFNVNTSAVYNGTKNVLFGGVAIKGTNNLTGTITTDPMLGTNGALLWGSPALEAATGSTMATDIWGNSRPSWLSPNADIGAYEFSPVNPVRNWNLFE